jgi:SNF2 family DNA or RNA helicase
VGAIEIVRLHQLGIPLQVEGLEQFYEFLARRKKLLDMEAPRVPTPWLREEHTAKDYQHEGIAWILQARKMILGDDVGLGKTFMTIGAYCCLRMLKPEARLVVVCPAGMRLQWAKQFLHFVKEDWIDVRDIAVVMGNAAGRQRALRRQAPVTIAHYESLLHDLKQNDSGDVWGPFHAMMDGVTMVAFDEASDSPGLRKPTSKIAYRAARITQKIPFLVALTATPQEKDVRDLFGIYNVIDPRIFGHPFHFDDVYLNWWKKKIWVKPKKKGQEPFEMVRKVPSSSKNGEHLLQRMSHAFLRRMVDDVKQELPALLPVPIVVSFRPKERKFYKQLEGRAMAAKDDKLFGSEVHNLRLFSCEPSLVKGMPADLKSPKTDKILDLVQHEFRSESILIFSQSKPYCQLLRRLLGSEAEIVVGGVSMKSRAAIQDRFNAGDIRIVVGDKAMTRGLNLQEKTSVVINADFPPLPSTIRQRIGRAYRPGAQAKVLRVVTILVEDTAEERAANRILERAKSFDRLFSKDIASPFDNLTIHEMKELLLTRSKQKRMSP